MILISKLKFYCYVVKEAKSKSGFEQKVTDTFQAWIAKDLFILKNWSLTNVQHHGKQNNTAKLHDLKCSSFEDT